MASSPGESVADLHVANTPNPNPNLYTLLTASSSPYAGSAIKLHQDQSSIDLPDRTTVDPASDGFASAATGTGAGKLADRTPSLTKGAMKLEEKMSQLLGDKEKEWTAISENRPLRLLDLPVDILREIIKEITHTNDLTALALTHSALHNLVIPHIYARFDIVWPDAHATTDNRSGVDALTYGLATLVMGEEVFGEAPNQQAAAHSHICAHCGHTSPAEPTAPPSKYTQHGRLRRRGNYFAQYTRKFSLGNGPQEWVHEYLIAKEGGKMLGTLVALAVARMVQLETFIWDMPTGVLRDVWMALSSLGDASDGRDCKLERVWIRWHDNRENSLLAPSPSSPSMPSLSSQLVPGQLTLSELQQYGRVEYPSFSILPPLKSLSVLDIDELAYLEEMAVLIQRCKDRLRELRVGIAEHAHSNAWVKLSSGQGSTAQATNTTDLSRTGGVLGVLLNKVCNFNNRVGRHGKLREMPAQTNLKQFASSTAEAAISKATAASTDSDSKGKRRGQKMVSLKVPNHKLTQLRATPDKLSLELLELERVPLSVDVMLKAFDWTRLTSLTLLDCQNHDQLWRALRRHYTPAAFQPRSTPSKSTSTSKVQSVARSTPVTAADYQLNLKRIHTDAVSSFLIAFLDQTLAPNSLEWLFLQDGHPQNSTVTIEAIYKGPIKRHRKSLKKLLIDSDERSPNGSTANPNRYRKWMFTREVLWFLTSKNMPVLKELGMSLDYKDWHFFLQRLPQIPQLRSLYIPHVAGHIHGRNVDSKELALQILDIITLLPSVEICYLGIQAKCFEILEQKVESRRHGAGRADSAIGSHGSGDGHGEGSADEEEEEDEDEEDGEEDGEEDEDDDHEEEDEEGEDEEDEADEEGSGEEEDADVDSTADESALAEGNSFAQNTATDESVTESEIDEVDTVHVSSMATNPSTHLHATVHTFSPGAHGAAAPGDIDDEDDSEDHDDLDDEHDDNDLSGSAFLYNDDEDEDEDSVLTDEEGGGHAGVMTVLKLREILFYDDKVAIFRARHGRL